MPGTAVIVALAGDDCAWTNADSARIRASDGMAFICTPALYDNSVPAGSTDRTLAEIDRARDEIVDFAARLIRIPTVTPPGTEYETCAAIIGDQLRAHGAEVQLL